MINNLQIEFDGWTIEYHHKPISGLDFEFYHDDYDGDNGLFGIGSSISDCLEQIINSYYVRQNTD